MPSNSLIASGAFQSLGDFSSESLMVPQIHGTDAAGIIAELSQILQRERRVPDLLPFYHAVLNREFLTSTAMDAGMAFPHARIDGIKQLSFALGRSSKPILWDPKNAVPVQLVFLLAVPATDATAYLHLVSGLARLGKENHFLAALAAAPGPKEMLSVLHQVQLRQGRLPAAGSPIPPLN